MKFNSLSLPLYLALVANIFFALDTIASPVYECKDSSGQIIYTDNPKATPDCNAATQKNIAPLPSFTPPSRTQDQTANSAAAPDTSVPKKSKSMTIANNEGEVSSSFDDTGEYEQNYSELSITSPINGDTLNSCGGLLDISFNVKPALVDGDLAVLIIDDKPYGEPTTSTTISTNSLERGPHTISVKIISKNNKILKTSEPVGFMFLRNCAKQSALPANTLITSSNLERPNAPSLKVIRN